jgi:glucose-1-phosphate cytidylyltransferase
MTVVQPPGRFGAAVLDGERVVRFAEKPRGDGGYINGGFFVLSPKVLGYIDGDDTGWEQRPLEQLAADGQLAAFRHDGFWLPMDTLRDKTVLEDLWNNGQAPWKLWP